MDRLSSSDSNPGVDHLAPHQRARHDRLRGSHDSDYAGGNRWRNWAACLALSAATLGGCGLTPPVVVPNVQAGKTNTQTIGTTQIREQVLVRPQAREINQSADENKLRVERVETIVQNEGPNPWWIVALVLAILLDSPLHWPAQIMAAFKRKKDD